METRGDIPEVVLLVVHLSLLLALFAFLFFCVGTLVPLSVFLVLLGWGVLFFLPSGLFLDIRILQGWE